MTEQYRKLKKNGLLLIGLMYLVLSLAVMVFSFYQVKQAQLDMLAHELVAPNADAFTFDEAYDVSWEKADITGPFTVFNGDGQIRGLFFQENTYIPPMIEGRYFSEDDFYAGKKVAVIGKSVGEDFVELIERDHYEIIGVMGTSHAAKIDHLILVNLDSLESPLSKRYTLHTDHRQQEAGVLSFANKQLSTTTILAEEAGTLNFIGANRYHPVITLIFYMLVIFFNILIVIAYFSKQKRHYEIMWKIGIRVKEPFVRNATACILVGTASYLFVGASSLFFAMTWVNRADITLHISNILMGYIIMFVCVLVMSSGIYFYTRAQIER
ncbi:ABC transporter permease [Salipaludibacillus sp. LMS25]|uniref:ABC transporter permease n=1 Tax=Salipaludibacillus sp. LMS25 TaxID=2924031 RepID=UPI0020D0BFD9|nr:ABC transporter permease [Salipaludibacillus sp. LMS25]UTR16882.1 ABC transporter permease [Salipaludibacillus sp. LMS25]